MSVLGRIPVVGDTVEIEDGTLGVAAAWTAAASTASGSRRADARRRRADRGR